jgi:hypothetical protein
MRLLKDMAEPELEYYINLLMSATQHIVPPDVEGFMIVLFCDDGITQYGSSITRETAVPALRELADRLEKRDGIERP